MPSPSHTPHLPPTYPASRQRPKSPNRVLAEAEAQWLFTEAELAQTPSIQDGMSQAEENEIRAKGVNFIVQVGIMLKLPQLTLSTASIFFQRFLMRASLKKAHNGIPKLHHYQSAATALFLATKVEESCRKMKELILAFCRVAQKNPNLMIDEQSKDWWRWRDCVLHNEDVLLETLCFDLTVESPHRQLFEMLKYYRIEHNKRLRNAAWGFVTDSNNTQLCLLCSSRTIAVASLYAACRYCDVSLPDDSKERPWWETQHVRLKEIRRAVEYMSSNYDHTANKVNGITISGGSDGNGSIYVGLSTPGMDGTNDGWDSTRMRGDLPGSVSPFPPPGSERRRSNASSVGVKRERAELNVAETAHHEDPNSPMNGVPRAGQDTKRPRLGEAIRLGGVPATIADREGSQGYGSEGEIKRREEAKRVEHGNQQAELDVAATATDASTRIDEVEGSEEGEVEE